MLTHNGISKIGIIKGGQLAKMFLQEVMNYGFQTYVFDEDPHAPCKNLCTKFTLGNPNDPDEVYRFGKTVDVLAIEFEDISVEGLERLEREGLPIFPSPSVLKIIQDKGTQKQFFRDHKIPTAEFVLLQNPSELEKYDSWFPSIQKLRRSGYDGKGIHLLSSKADLKTAIQAPFVLEKKVNFLKEIAIMVARDSKGSVIHYPAVEMEFHPHKHLVEFLFAPADLAPELEQKAAQIALKVAEAFQLVGIMAVEMFVLESGEILVNEVSPRLHNSGHHTIEANITSQYEQFLRIILNLPLGSTATLMPSAMVNILGEEGYSGQAIYQGLEKILALEKVYLHLYGKKETRPYRKMGHATILGDSLENVREKAYLVKNILKVIA